MTTHHFLFRPSVRPSRPGHIHLRITHSRQSRTISLPLKIYPEQWEDAKERSTDEHINQQLDENQALIKRIVTILEQQGDYTVADIALRYRCQSNTDSLVSFTEQLANVYNHRQQNRTARAYLCAASRLVAFCGNKLIRLSDITASLIENFEKSLQNEGLSRNTTSFYMRNLRAIYHKAVEMKEIIRQEESPFARVFTGTEKTRKRALSQEEINNLYNVNIQNNSNLRFARQLFFFGFHACGMSFVDMAYLKKSDVRNSIIRYRRKKTGKLIEVKITKALKKLIDFFYNKNPNMPYLLPIITDPNKDERLQYESALRLQNKRLKLLGNISLLKHTLTTHVCRHSWASLARKLNIPLAVISESLGHSDEKTTAIYLASFDRSVLDKVCERVSALIKTSRPSILNCSSPKVYAY